MSENDGGAHRQTLTLDPADLAACECRSQNRRAVVEYSITLLLSALLNTELVGEKNDRGPYCCESGLLLCVRIGDDSVRLTVFSLRLPLVSTQSREEGTSSSRV